MAHKICYVNYKGGVGKTSMIVNTGASLAKRGNRVMIVDLDTQSNASIWLMRLDRWNRLNTTGYGSIYSTFNPGTERLKDIIVRDVVVDKAGQKILPGLDVMPTTFNLVDLENEYAYDPKHPPYVQFHNQLAEVEEDYDYILFDCPPNVLSASQCGVFTSNHIFVPANPDALSLIGLTLLVEKALLFHRRSASFRESGMGPVAQVRGVIFNSIKGNEDIEVPKMRMQLRLNQFMKQKRVATNVKIFESKIRDAVVVRRAVTLGLPVNMVVRMSGDDDNVAADYDRVAREIERQMQGMV